MVLENVEELRTFKSGILMMIPVLASFKSSFLVRMEADLGQSSKLNHRNICMRFK